MNGDSFWKGASIGLTTAGLNHLQHKSEEIKFFHRLRRHYHKGGGKDFILNRREFEYLVKRGRIINEDAIADANGYYLAGIDFYDSGFDLKYSFGKARVKYYVDDYGKTIFAGFHDYYNFDAKPWGVGRSYLAEIITRTYGSLPGNPFNVYFNKGIF